MDFIEQLVRNVNEIQGLPMNCSLGYLQPNESFCLYGIPGSRVVLEYMDGAKDELLNYEFAMKSDDQQKINDTLWLVSNHLEKLSELESLDGSFNFNSIYITNKPFINQMDDKKNYIFLLNVQANVTTYPE